MEILQELVADTVHSIQSCIETLDSEIDVMMDNLPPMPTLDDIRPMENDIFFNSMFDELATAGGTDDIDINNDLFAGLLPPERDFTRQNKRYEELRQVYHTMEKKYQTLCNEYVYQNRCELFMR